MLNYRLVAESLRRAADQLDQPSISIDLEDESTYKQVQDFTGEVELLTGHTSLGKFQTSHFSYVNFRPFIAFTGESIRASSPKLSGNLHPSEDHSLLFRDFQSIDLQDLHKVSLYLCNQVHIRGTCSSCHLENCESIKLESAKNTHLQYCKELFCKNPPTGLRLTGCEFISFGFDPKTCTQEQLDMRECKGKIKIV